MQTEN